MPNTREKPMELINKWDVVNKLIQLENNYNFYKDVWDADVLYRRICELEIGIGKTPPVAYNLSPTEQKWIPVTERLPEKSDYYLAFTDNGIISVLPFSLQYRAFNAFDGDGTEHFIPCTHWMPLPEPPKGE